jgi:hypothetical protein
MKFKKLNESLPSLNEFKKLNENLDSSVFMVVSSKDKISDFDSNFDLFLDLKNINGFLDKHSGNWIIKTDEESYENLLKTILNSDIADEYPISVSKSNDKNWNRNFSKINESSEEFYTNEDLIEYFTKNNVNHEIIDKIKNGKFYLSPEEFANLIEEHLGSEKSEEWFNNRKPIYENNSNIKEKKYFIEYNGENWQSVFPEIESEKSNVHNNVSDAWNYMTDEVGTNKNEISISIPNLDLDLKIISNVWKKIYNEDLKTQYSGFYKFLYQEKDLNLNLILDLWGKLYGENMIENYSGFFDYLAKDLKRNTNESYNADFGKKTTLSEKISNLLEENTSYEDFAKSVYEVLEKDYGKHNYSKFLKTLTDLINKNINESTRNNFSVGSKYKISGGSGLLSGKIVTIIDSKEIKTDGRGVPTNTYINHYKPVDWPKEVAIKFEDGKIDTMFKNRLTKIINENLNKIITEPKEFANEYGDFLIGLNISNESGDNLKIISVDFNQIGVILRFSSGSVMTVKKSDINKIISGKEFNGYKLDQKLNEEFSNKFLTKNDVGKRVIIKVGRDKGQTGILEKYFNKYEVEVLIDSTKRTSYVQANHVELLDNNSKNDLNENIDSKIKYITINEEFENEFFVNCMDGSETFWSSKDEKIELISLEDAHSFGKKICNKKICTWYSIFQNGKELYKERTKFEDGKFVTGYLNANESLNEAQITYTAKQDLYLDLTKPDKPVITPSKKDKTPLIKKGEKVFFKDGKFFTADGNDVAEINKSFLIKS